MTQKKIGAPPKGLRFAFPPQCYTWHGRARCERRATVYLFAPDGTPNPGGWVCQEHADATVTEYRDKLGEHWTYRPLIIESPVRASTMEEGARN